MQHGCYSANFPTLSTPCIRKVCGMAAGYQKDSLLMDLQPLTASSLKMVNKLMVHTHFYNLWYS